MGVGRVRELESKQDPKSARAARILKCSQGQSHRAQQHLNNRASWSARRSPPSLPAHLARSDGRSTHESDAAPQKRPREGRHDQPGAHEPRPVPPLDTHIPAQAQGHKGHQRGGHE
eukprot:scaffold99177_cov24-Tisochrysis_lutea.AAC.3